MKVKNHKKFLLNEYLSEPIPAFQLGDILYRDLDGGEIGVVIQTEGNGDTRTDTWGWGEGQLATLEQIERIRPELIPEIEWELNS